MAAPVHEHPEPAGPAPGPTGPSAAGSRWRTPAVVGLAGAGACAALAAWSPGDGGTPLCWTQAALGVDCPFCGGLRATGALLRGDWLAAADHNVVLAVVLPLVAVAWAVWLVRSIQDRPAPRVRVARGWWVALGAFLVAFTLARNSDTNTVFAWLHSSAWG